jgi:glutamyl/glutaminyl-tRNA synthetase
MPPRLRIAPTPSGFLHLGNAVDFLLVRQWANELEGTVRLRVDDQDQERVRAPYVQDIFDTLRWLGIAWEEGPCSVDDLSTRWSQVLRRPRYALLLDKCAHTGHVYACTCSRHQLALARTPCTCSTKDLPLATPGAAWRWRLPRPCTAVLMTRQGPREHSVSSAWSKDPIVRQSNAQAAYHIASLADDVDYGITHIVRGEDLLASTLFQLHLAERLGLQSFGECRFFHHPLLVDANGQKLSKGHGAPSLNALRQRGCRPEEVRAVALRYWVDTH